MARPSIEVGRKKHCFLMPKREGGPVIGKQAAMQSVPTRECTIFVLIISLLLKELIQNLMIWAKPQERYHIRRQLRSEMPQ